MIWELVGIIKDLFRSLVVVVYLFSLSVLFYLIYWTASALLSSSLWGISPSASWTTLFSGVCASFMYLEGFFFGDSFNINYIYIRITHREQAAAAVDCFSSSTPAAAQSTPSYHTHGCFMGLCSHSKRCRLRRLSSLRSRSCCCYYFWPLPIGNATIRACCKHIHTCIQAESATATAPQANVTNFTNCKQTNRNNNKSNSNSNNSGVA